MGELAKLRNRPVALAPAIGCLNGLIWAAYYAVAKHAGLTEIVLAFLGGIPTVGFVAWIIIVQAQAAAARREAMRAAGTPLEAVGPVALTARLAVGCLGPTLSVIAGLIAGIGLMASGAYHEWSHPDQIALVLIVPAATLLGGIVSTQIPAVGRRAALVAIGGSLGAGVVAALLGLAGYLMYPLVR
jgi:hypothetical protein